MLTLPKGLKEKQLPEMLWTMMLGREIELREESLKKQGKGWFQIGGGTTRILSGGTISAAGAIFLRNIYRTLTNSAHDNVSRVVAD